MLTHPDHFPLKTLPDKHLGTKSKKSVAQNCCCSGCQMLVRHPEGHRMFGVRSVLEHGGFHCNKQLHIQGLANGSFKQHNLERVIEGHTLSSCRDGGGARKSCTTLPPCGDTAQITTLIYIRLYLKSSSIIVLKTLVSTHLYHLIMRFQGWGANVRGHFSTKSINPCVSSDTDLQQNLNWHWKQGQFQQNIAPALLDWIF